MRVLSAVTIALMLVAAPVDARQEALARFTVAVASANVREHPSTSSAVISRLPRGAVVDVIEQRDGWVRVVLQDDRNRTTKGYVLGSLGRVEANERAAAAPAVSALSDAPVSTVAPPSSAPTPPIAAHAPEPSSSSQVVVQGPPPALPPPAGRTIGVGGRIGGFTFGVGGSARVWSKGNLGMQLDISRYSIGSSDSFGGISVGVKYSVMQFGPSVLYKFDTSDDGDVWLRPYAGGGLNFYRSTISSSVSGLGESEKTSESASNVGFQVVGGAELVFKDLPRLGVSGDLGYYSTGTPFVGLQIGGFAYGVSLHWYVK